MLDLLDGIHCLLRDDRDPTLLHFRAQMLAHIVVETTQNVFGPVDKYHLRAKAVENARKLDRNIAAALDEDARRQVLEVKSLVGGDDVLQAGNLGAEGRRSTGRDQNDVSSHPVAVGEQAHRVRVLDLRAAPHEGDFCALERRNIGRLEARDLAILVGDQLCPFERRLVPGPAISGGILELLGQPRGRDKELLWTPPANEALTAYP